MQSSRVLFSGPICSLSAPCKYTTYLFAVKKKKRRVLEQVRLAACGYRLEVVTILDMIPLHRGAVDQFYLKKNLGRG